MPESTTAKDLILFILQNIGTDGGVGHVIEYRGEAIKALSMEGRMTICNMSIEGGARAGMIAPDEITFEYLKDKPYAPKGEEWEKAVQEWNKLYTDEGAVFDKEVVLDVTNLTPYVTWGTTPAQAISIDSEVPMPKNPNEEKALEYMGLKPGTPMKEINIDAVFIGSCTNSRIEDLRAAAEIVKGHKVKDGVKAMVVPGSMKVKDQAVKEGLANIFINADFEWRASGCSMCVGMNDDVLEPGQRCASTSNRNFEGRQGKGARTRLVSPAVAAASAIMGKFASPSDIIKGVTQ